MAEPREGAVAHDERGTHRQLRSSLLRRASSSLRAAKLQVSWADTISNGRDMGSFFLVPPFPEDI